ncbi:DUF6221 family protein [Actinomadura sp. 9N215]|uniref:DUF6221 family protein n=1 Tax=Actinomadura sp. 9N215 TaxID=3375150 RepID=UPI0037ABA1D1
MSDLVEFLRARLLEDERSASDECPDGGRDQAARELAEVESKRQQIDLCEYLSGWTDEHDTEVTAHEIKSMRKAADLMLRRVALPYADHPDHNPAWRP